MKKTTVIVTAVLLALVSLFTACKKNDQSTAPAKQGQQAPLTEQAFKRFFEDLQDSVKGSTAYARQYNSLSAYNYLPSTGNNYNTFSSSSGYGVEIRRSSFDPPTISVNPVVQAWQGWYQNGYTSAYLYDANFNLKQSWIAKTVNVSNTRPFPSINITGGDRLWLLFYPKTSGQYMYWY